MDGAPRLLSLWDGTAMVWRETAGYVGGLTPASIVANGKSTALVPIGRRSMARCAYSAFCTWPDEGMEKILFFRGRINYILLFFRILCCIWRFLSFFRIGKGGHKGPGDAVGGSARALLSGVVQGAGNIVLVARSRRGKAVELRPVLTD